MLVRRNGAWTSLATLVPGAVAEYHDIDLGEAADPVLEVQFTAHGQVTWTLSALDVTAEPWW